MNTKGDPNKLFRMFRIRIASAESKLEVLREQARKAKRRRKAAKRVAQRAQKQFKQFKAKLDDLRHALAKAETNLFKAGRRTLGRKIAKTKRVAKREALQSKKQKIVARKPRRSVTRESESRAPARARKKKPPITAAKITSDSPHDVAAIEPTQTTSQI
jgi:hypothetical protein